LTFSSKGGFGEHAGKFACYVLGQVALWDCLYPKVDRQVVTGGSLKRSHQSPVEIP